MKIKLWKDRNVMLVVLTAFLRMLSASTVGYLSARDVPPELIDQVSTAIASFGVLAFNVWWELFDRRKAVKTAELRAAVTATVLEKMGVNRV